MTDIEERLAELRELGLYRRHADGQRAPGPARRARRQARPAAVLEQLPRPRRPPARARGRGRRGDALGRRRRRVAARVGQHDAPPAPRGAPRGASRTREAALLFGSGYLANLGVVSALAREGEVVLSDELNHASIVDGCRLARAETFVYRHGDLEHLAWGLRNAAGRGALIVTDGVFSMDGDVAPLEEIVELARRHGVRVMVDDAHGTGCTRPGRPRRGRRGGPRGRGRRRRRHARQGARLLRRVCRAATTRWRATW